MATTFFLKILNLMSLILYGHLELVAIKPKHSIFNYITSSVNTSYGYKSHFDTFFDDPEKGFIEDVGIWYS
jgi:hypothetical protein